jgi:Tfp pilus assembly protein PilE
MRHVASPLLRPILVHPGRRLTVLDLLTAIVVAGTVATMAIPGYVESRAETADALMQSAAVAAADAEELYRAAHGGYLGNAPCSALPRLRLPSGVQCRLDGGGQTRFRLTTWAPGATARLCVWDSGATPPLACG